MISRSTDVRAALRSRQRGFLLNPARFGGAPPPATDPHYANVSLLLHGDGSDGGTTFTDNSPSPKSPTLYGNVQRDTAQFKFGTASILFDGAGDFLEYTNNAAFEFGTGDFTMECFVRFAAFSAAYGGSNYGATLFGSYKAGVGGPVGFGFRVDGTATAYNTINAYSGNTTMTFGGFSLSLNTWYHIALCRSGTSLRAFVDGVQVGSTVTNSENWTASQATIRPLRIGQLNDATFLFPVNGWMDEIRITKGVARYTAAFTPPTAAFPNS